MKGLYFKLIGVINDATGLSESLRKHGSIRVINDTKKGGQFAMVEFIRTEDGPFISPTTELTEKDINFFLIRVVNAYQGSEMIVRTGEKEKPKEIRIDRFDNQYCNISKAGTIIRVSRWGKVEIFHVTSPTVNNQKQIKIFSVFEDNLPFENPSLLDAVIKDEPILKQFESDIKQAYATIQQQPKFENKMDLSQAKYRSIQSKQGTPREYTKVEAPTESRIEEEAPVEKIGTEPKTAPKEKTVKRNPDEKKTATQVKTAKAEDQKREAEEEIEDAKAEKEKEDKKSSPVKAETDKAELKRIQEEAAQGFKTDVFSEALEGFKKEKTTAKKSTTKK